jgi:hypothetical protein
MSSSGHQHHHGVTKNIVEGIGGVIIGAAAVLLLARVFKHNKPAAAAAPKAAEKATEQATAKATAKPAPAKTTRAKLAPKPAPKPAVAQPEAVAAPVVKRASRARAKPAVSKAKPGKSEANNPESNES